MKVQFNCRLMEETAKRVRIDAVKNNKTLDSVMESIVSDFFKSWTPKEREAFYAKAENKLTGSKVVNLPKGSK